MHWMKHRHLLKYHRKVVLDKSRKKKRYNKTAKAVEIFSEIRIVDPKIFLVDEWETIEKNCHESQVKRLFGLKI